MAALAVASLSIPLVSFIGLGATQAPATASGIPSSQGTDFWVGFESNYEGGNNLFLFISGATATTGTVSDSAISFSQSFSVTPGTVTTIPVPSGAENDASDSVVADGAVHVTAGAPVSAYGLNTQYQTTDGYLGLPTTILGTSYLAEGYGGGGGSQFMVIGTQNSTTVTITPSEDVDGYTAGVPYTETLNQGDEYQLIDDGGGDISGTLITSSAPVAVFAGNNCADVPQSAFYCNTLAEEMTPTDTWGTDFLTEPLATRSGDTFRFMASKNDTTVDVDGSSVATLNSGQEYETILTSASSITANNPIQVMQYSNGQTYDGANADPFDITIPPTEQFLNSYTVTTEPSGADPAITQNYLNIVAPTSETSSIDLDGADLPSSDFTPIAGTSYSGAQIPVAFGDHNVSASLPFGLSIYGYGNDDGYGYPGGFTLSPIAVVSKVTLAPTSSTDTVGASACETATVTDQDGNPVSGVRVDFTVTGVNPTSGFAYSATNGTAQFCYSGTTAGTDTEQAAVGSVTSNMATIDWTSLPPTTTTTSLSGGGQSGASISVPPSTAVTDHATLAGAKIGTAGGTVTYTTYSDPGCTSQVATGTYPVSDGTASASGPVTLSTPGKYYWLASYSGDSTNAPSATTCGSEVETVISGTSTPTCSVTAVNVGAPSQLVFSVQDSVSGLSAVKVIRHQNSTSAISSFAPGTTSPVTVTFTKKVETSGGGGGVKATNEDDKSVSCVGQYKTVKRLGVNSQGFTFLKSLDNLVIQNGSPGLESVKLTLNGAPTTTVTLTPGETYTRTLSGLSKVNHLVVSGVGIGKRAAAVVALWGYRK
jgi:hypothetical protein